MEHARRIPAWLEAAIVLGLLALIGAVSFAAPQSKGPVLVGTLERKFDSPVVTIPDDDGPRTYWLAFADPAVEVQTGKLPTGTRVAVWGRVGAGGIYRYAIVTSIHPDE